MHYVILRDDDTNALTRPEWLERLHRPFLQRGWPVHLSVIPNVRTDVRRADGQLEGFLIGRNGTRADSVAIGENGELVKYLQRERGYHIVQHGYHHEYMEFARIDPDVIAYRLNHGTQLLNAAGFASPETFVAPHDRFTAASFREVARRFRVVSTGWFELERLPRSWWPRYALKRLRGQPHWRIGSTVLLSHPGCLLSCERPYDTMLDTVRRQIESQRLTVLVTHWWEYFRNGQPDEPFIRILHDIAAYLADNSQIKIVTFADVANGNVPLV